MTFKSKSLKLMGATIFCSMFIGCQNHTTSKQSLGPSDIVIEVEEPGVVVRRASEPNYKFYKGINRFREQGSSDSDLTDVPDQGRLLNLSHVIRDRVYPLNIRISKDAFVVNLDYFVPESSDLNLSLMNAFDPRNRACSKDMHFEILATEAVVEQGRYVPIFRTYEDCEIFRSQLISGKYISETSVDLGSVTQALLQADRDFSKAFDINGIKELPSDEAILNLFVILETDKDQTTWQADFGWHNLAFYRVFRPKALSETPLLRTLKTTVIHEGLHKWIGKAFNTYESPNSDVQTIWMKEGYTEYFAVKYAYKNNIISDAELVHEVQNKVNACLEGLGSLRSKKLTQMKRGHTPYNCGFFHAFILGANLDKNGQGSLINYLASKIRKDETGDLRINASEILDPFGFEENDTVFIDETAVLNLGNIVRALKETEFEFEALPSEDKDKYVSGVVMYLTRNECGDGAQGFWVEDDQVILDNPDCASIPHKSVITKIETYGVRSEPILIAKKISEICSKPHGKINLTIDNKKKAINCPSDPLEKTINIIFPGEQKELLGFFAK